MKKIWLLSICCVCIFVGISDSYGAKNCKAFACPKDTSKIGENKEYIQATIGGGQCYSCDSDDYSFGDNECGYQANVGQTDIHGEIVDIYTCVDISWSAYDEWHKSNPTRLCQNSPLGVTARGKANVKTRYLLDGFATKRESGGEQIVNTGGSTGCVYYTCEENYKPNADKTGCARQNANCTDATGKAYSTGDSNNAAKCQMTGGKVVDGLTSLSHVTGKCTQTCMSNGWKIRLNDGACANQWIVASDAKSCIENPAVVKKRQQKHNEQVREKCENSYGTWNGSKCTCDKTQKHLVLSGDKCVCESADYEFDTSSKSCKIKDVVKMKQECTASVAQASGAYWDIEKKICACDDDSKHFVRGKCEYKPAVIACGKIVGAKWTGTECKCTTAGYVVNEEKTQCVKSDALIKTEEQAESRIKIGDLYKKLNGMSNDFKVSVWKNADGNFNTARLTSDSIAAVVLGTTGALVTSNVVKKNQVSSGFEDINCQIGGQTVAGWGDEFSVGMQ